MNVVPFKKEHFDRMIPRELGAIESYGSDRFRQALEAYERDPSWTMLTPAGEIVFFGGVYILWPGVGEAWSVMSSLVEKYPLAVCREIRRKVAEAFHSHKLRRIQTIIMDDNPRAVKLMRLAGFEIEGILRNYSPDGKDCFMLGRVIEWKS